MREPVYVTKTHLPDRKRLDAYIDRIYESNRLTNNGPLLRELTARLEAYLGVENLLLVSNGTLALQIAYRALGLAGEAVTTPFSFVATASSLAWEGIKPVFADIDPKTFCLDPGEIEKAITPGTRAIVPVHVYGNACEIETIEAIAKRHGLRTVYDAAHAFGVRYRGKSILSYGDASTLSFHATKTFHTIEGGAIVFRERAAFEKAQLMINFGIDGPDSVAALGVNAKMNEFQAAMGLAVLDEIESVLAGRAKVWQRYRENLEGRFRMQEHNPDGTANFAHFPVVFETGEGLARAVEELNRNNIFPRRYFHPSLDTLGFAGDGRMENSRSVAARVLCLPLHSGLGETDQLEIIQTVLSAQGLFPEQEPS